MFFTFTEELNVVETTMDTSLNSSATSIEDERGTVNRGETGNNEAMESEKGFILILFIKFIQLWSSK